jgi:hypothetical protein
MPEPDDTSTASERARTLLHAYGVQSAATPFYQLKTLPEGDIPIHVGTSGNMGCCVYRRAAAGNSHRPLISAGEEQCPHDAPP